jgi:hypothetical protein
MANALAASIHGHASIKEVRIPGFEGTDELAELIEDAAKGNPNAPEVELDW